MARLTDLEPLPRRPSWPCARHLWDSSPRTLLPRDVREPDIALLEVLRRRRSTLGAGPISTEALASLLWHATLLRERRPAGQHFPLWESRTAPSAGGLHVISLLCLPLDCDQLAGIYDPDHHELIVLPPTDLQASLHANKISVAEICGATSGTTLQFVAEVERGEAAYENYESLLWRDAGVLLAVVVMIANALGLAATPLGRIGNNIVRAAGLHEPTWYAVGAVHLSSVGPVAPSTNEGEGTLR